MKISILALALFFASGRAADPSAQSEWVYPCKDGKLIYKTSPSGDKILDFSHAGYKGGGVKLPVIQVKKSVRPTGKADDTELIQKAIDEVSALPQVKGFRGAILLEPGVYTCLGTISISYDGVVLQGSGSGKNGSTIEMKGGKHTAITIGNIITLDIPVTDSFDPKFSEPTGTVVTKVDPADLVSQSGVENLHIQAPPMEMSYEQAPYSALRINGRDCWAKNLLIEETMNSVGVNGSRITLEDVKITRTVPNVGASKPAEFAPNAGQILLNRCSSIGDNIWHVATGAGQAGPIVLLYCTFGGAGHLEGHQRWTTGILLDNCQVPDGGIDLKNRGSMGSGHGWGSAWSGVWNCSAKSYVVQQLPGAYNWLIGSTGTNLPTARPFNQSPALHFGISDSPGLR